MSHDVVTPDVDRNISFSWNIMICITHDCIVRKTKNLAFNDHIPLLRVLRDEISLRVNYNSFLKQCRKLSFLTLALVSCSPNLPWVFMTQYVQRKHEPILKYKRNNNDKNSTSLACFWLLFEWIYIEMFPLLKCLQLDAE